MFSMHEELSRFPSVKVEQIYTECPFIEFDVTDVKGSGDGQKYIINAFGLVKSMRESKDGYTYFGISDQNEI